MGGMDRVRYPAFRMGATPAVWLLLLAGCHHSPIEGKTVAEWEKQLREGDAIDGEEFLGVDGLVEGFEVGFEVGDFVDIFDADDDEGRGGEAVFAGVLG